MNGFVKAWKSRGNLFDHKLEKVDSNKVRRIQEQEKNERKSTFSQVHALASITLSQFIYLNRKGTYVI